ncbi:MAG: YdbL family protein [Ectothiorhodospiraceae bacterium]|nr:YdbL family protein [Ectothiorhodospiraceae bacterium]
MLRTAPLFLLALALTACVTINVYFPAVAAEQAADRIIQDVWGREQSPPPEAGEPQSRLTDDHATPLAVRVLNALVPTAAAASPDLDISSPAIRQLTASMEARHSQLQPHYQSGAIGLTRDGQITVRDQSAVPLADRNRLRQLVSDENADRQNLYRQIAVANGHPEWESDIRQTFAERWVANARSGWYYQDRQGNWQQK